MSTPFPTPDFVYDLPDLQISESAFTPHIPYGESWKASFFLRAEGSSQIEGKVTSDNRRIVLASDAFSGTTPEILFGVDSKGLSVDETIDGTIRISSNLGEVAVPIHAVIVEAPDEGFDPEIRALEDFEQLCKKSMREGFRLFTHPAFPQILNGKNVVYLPLYKGMAHNPVTYQHLEEFLIASGKKEPIYLSLDKQQKAVYHLDISQKDTLYIYKNNWGYIHIEIRVEGDFLEIPRADLSSDDFIGDVCGLEYIVHRDRIGKGRAFGRIILKTVHQELVYEIEASAKEESEIQPRAVRSRRISWLMRDFLKLQLHELDYRTWQDSSAMTVGELLEEDTADTWAILYSAYLRYTQDDNAKAMETLWPIKEGAIRLETREKKAVYLWLAKKVGLLPIESRNIRPTLLRYYERQPSSYVLLYLLQQESEDLPGSPAQRWEELEACFRAGCTSPFLYLAAWEMLQKEEALLRELNPFMQQVLCFGMKQGRLTEGLLKRTAALSAGQKTYNSAIFRILTNGYRLFPDDAVLESICQLLVRGEPMKKECFPWYERAITRDIRMTRLYEYYMETYDRPAAETIPQDVRVYFATNNVLSEKKKALLYASVILHREEDPTGYMNYAKNMREFAQASLKRGRINKDYAVLYQHFFAHPEDKETAEDLTKVLFVQRVTVSNKEIRQVIVCHNALKKETIYPCREGIAYPKIYSEDACLLFEDDQHRRFATTVTYTKEPMFATRDIAQACMKQGVDHAGLELFLCKEKAFQMDVNSRTLADYCVAEKNAAFTETYRRTIRRKLLEYAWTHPEQEISSLLPVDKTDLFAEADRATTIQLLIREERYEEAFRVITETGFEKVPAPLLKELAAHRIRATEGVFEEELLYLSAHVFSEGEQDDDLLLYLQQYYDGPLSSLCHLWESLYGAGLDPLLIEEKILLTAVRTRQIPEHHVEILQDYMRRGGKEEVTDLYLTYLAGQYFLGQRRTEEPVFEAIETAIREGHLQEDICKLALLRQYAAKESLSAAQKELAYTLLREENRKGYRFAFYQQLPSSLTEGLELEDKVMIEEQIHPDARVILHYQIKENGSATGEWVSEPMPQMFHGIFHQEFQMFYGDEITYDLRVMIRGAIQNLDAKTIRCTATGDGKTRASLLHRMRKALLENDPAAWRKEAANYQKETEQAARMFALIKETDG